MKRPTFLRQTCQSCKGNGMKYYHYRELGSYLEPCRLCDGQGHHIDVGLVMFFVLGIGFGVALYMVLRSIG